MCRSNHFLYGIDGSQHIRNMSHRYQSGTRREELLIFVEQQFATVVHGNHFQHNSLTRRLQLPRNDVTVMLHNRNNHFITFLHLTVGKRRSQQVDALRRAPCKHDFIATACIDKTTYSLTRSFMQLGSLLRQEMHTTMHIGIDRIIFIGYGFNHLARFLSGSPIIQINKRLSIHLPI